MDACLCVYCSSEDFLTLEEFHCSFFPSRNRETFLPFWYRGSGVATTAPAWRHRIPAFSMTFEQGVLSSPPLLPSSGTSLSPSIPQAALQLSSPPARVFLVGESVRVPSLNSVVSSHGRGFASRSRLSVDAAVRRLVLLALSFC